MSCNSGSDRACNLNRFWNYLHILLPKLYSTQSWMPEMEKACWKYHWKWPLALKKYEILWQSEFFCKKFCIKKKICIKKVVGKQDLKCSKFYETSNWHTNLPFNARGLKLGHFGTFDLLFPFLAFLRILMQNFPLVRLV